MSVIKDLLEERGIVVTNSRVSGPRARLLQQANAMIAKLSDFTEPTQLDSKTTSQNWWSPMPHQDKRRIIMRYAGMTVDETSTYVDNTLEAVMNTIAIYKLAIEKTTDADWADEELKRKKK
jgi:hypothetical protein